MYIGNTSYHVYTKNNKIENPFKERTPTLFDFISDNVKVVDGKIKVKDGLEKNIKNTKDVVLIPDDALIERDDFLRKNKKINGVNEREQLQAFHVSHAFDKAIEAVEAGRYEWFMSKIGKITYKNGEFFA